eukprot:TRINITY_DN44721_c0_g1_i1.p1 TRINITY_DN44721_c0_g1~~TRINITY_DN44721_c0_g1_i1.p1  ORF type:complete len:494 (+),score=59.68 TRINITY_DN44721_c0_g1_i1:45-1484(+)
MEADERTALRSGSGETAGSCSRLRAPLYTYAVSFMAALNSLNLGFDIGVTSGVAVLIQKDLKLSNWQIGLFMGSLHFIAVIGGLASYTLSDRLGRCRTFTISQLIFLVGVAIFCLANSFAMLMVSRVFLGFAIGISFSVNPLYISEIAPAALRGQLTSFVEICVNLGILIGFIANWMLADLPDGLNWRVMAACGAVLPALIGVLSVTTMPESPRWLVTNDRLQDAEDILRRTHHPGEDISALISGIKQRAITEASYADLGWEPLLKPDDATCRAMLIGLGVAFAQQISGSESVVLYSPEIFRQAGVANTVRGLFEVTISIGVVKTALVVVASCLLDSVGRRPLLVVSTVGIAASQFLLSAALSFGASRLAVLAVCLFIGSFSFGIGPITWVLASEVFPSHIRAKAMGTATAMNRATSGIIAVTFLPLVEVLGLSGYYLFFACISTAVAIWSYYVVPETKQRTLEQLTEYLSDGKLPKSS